jgi:hypothetical protein
LSSHSTTEATTFESEGDPSARSDRAPQAEGSGNDVPPDADDYDSEDDLPGPANGGNIFHDLIEDERKKCPFAEDGERLESQEEYVDESLASDCDDDLGDR